MKVLLTICLLLVMPVIAIAQRASLNRAQTREAEQRLADMGYWTGAVDGVFDPATRAALTAFQKWEGRAVTGKLTLDELEAIRRGAPPKALEEVFHTLSRRLKVQQRSRPIRTTGLISGGRRTRTS